MDVSLVRTALLAEQIEIFLRALDIACEPEQHIRSCHVRGSVALSCVRPVDKVRRTVVFYDDIGRVEIAVAEFVVLGHTFQSRVQLIFYTFVKISQVYFPIHLVAEFSEQGAFFGLNLDLPIDELFKILVFLVGILFHKSCKGFALYILGHDRPLPVDFGDFDDFGHVEPGLFHSCLIESLVEHVHFGEIVVEHFDAVFSVVVDGFVCSYGNDSVKIHILLLIKPLCVCHSMR